MILFTTLLFTLIILAAVAIIGIGVFGSAIIVVFGDVIVFIALIVLIIKHFRKKRK